MLDLSNACGTIKGCSDETARLTRDIESPRSAIRNIVETVTTIKTANNRAESTLLNIEHFETQAVKGLPGCYDTKYLYGSRVNLRGVRSKVSKYKNMPRCHMPGPP